MSIDQDLMDLKSTIEKAKSSADRTEGAISETRNRLKTEFNLETEAEIDAELYRLELSMTAMERSLEIGVANLKVIVYG